MSVIQVQKQHDARVSVEVDGQDLGVWDEFSPPDEGSDTGEYRPGGQRHAFATPGLPESGDATVTRVLTRENANSIHRRLLQRRGIARMKVTDQPVDMRTGDPWGDPVIYTGILSGVAISDYDSDGDDNRTVELTMHTDTQTG